MMQFNKSSSEVKEITKDLVNKCCTSLLNSYNAWDETGPFVNKLESNTSANIYIHLWWRPRITIGSARYKLNWIQVRKICNAIRAGKRSYKKKRSGYLEETQLKVYADLIKSKLLDK